MRIPLGIWWILGDSLEDPPKDLVNFLGTRGVSSRSPLGIWDFLKDPPWDLMDFLKHLAAILKDSP